jgi:hypothetical protein
VRALTVEDYDEILSWLQDEADRSRGGEGSVDMDALIASKRQARGEED